MKKLLVSLFVVFSFTSLRAQQAINNNGTPPHSFAVHEWGTFTTLSGSDGVLLPGLYHEEEQLPYFVYHQPGFANGGYIHKGLSLDCENATLKMETPVIYFYSDTARSVSVRVDWPGGTISQWYPQRTDGEPQPTGGYLDFATPYNGWIQWNANVLARSATDTTGIWKSGETHTWQSPRTTDANVVTDSAGEVEKFLFYRGVGNAKFMDGAEDGHYLLHTTFHGDTLVIDNMTFYNISYAFVYELSQDSTTRTVWWSGPIDGAGEVRCTGSDPEKPLSFTGALAAFRNKLVEAGLYGKEADAMINTWQQSYFGTPGLRVFWIVPRLSTDRSLPLTITPAPDSLERVLVARSEVLTPAFEKQLVETFANGNGYSYYNDRYYLAYQARVAAMSAAAAVQPDRPLQNGIGVYPNPTTGALTVAFSSDPRNARVTLTDALGREQSLTQRTSGRQMQFDLSGLPAGVYLLRAELGGIGTMQRVVKE